MDMFNNVKNKGMYVVILVLHILSSLVVGAAVILSREYWIEFYNALINDGKEYSIFNFLFLFIERISKIVLTISAQLFCLMIIAFVIASIVYGINCIFELSAEAEKQLLNCKSFCKMSIFVGFIGIFISAFSFYLIVQEEELLFSIAFFAAIFLILSNIAIVVLSIILLTKFPKSYKGNDRRRKGNWGYGK